MIKTMSGKNLFSSPFVSSNPIYKAAVNQRFSGEEIHFGPLVEVLEMLYANISFGNFFFLIIDYRSFTYPYISPNSVEVMGYTPGEITNLEWLLTVIDPNHLPKFNDYGLKMLSFATTYPAEHKNKIAFSHCLRIWHGRRKEYIWLYQQHHMSYTDRNGALVYSITVVTDVTHLHGSDTGPSWSVTEQLDDGSYRYLIGSAWEQQPKLPGKRLTPRDLDILNLSARGFGTEEIAKKLRIGTETVITHRKKILQKTNSKNMPEAVAHALYSGYL
jgi:DNA-binding CsgD family transcriptional regulator